MKKPLVNYEFAGFWKRDVKKGGNILMDALLGVIGFLGFIIFVVIGIVKAIARKPVKKTFAFAGVALVLFIVALSMTSSLETENVAEPELKNAEQEEIEKEVAKKKVEEIEKAKKEEETEKVRVEAEKKKEEAAAAKKLEEEKKEEEARKIEEAKKAKGIDATVTRIIDGDTIEVMMNGKEEQIRVLLIDTPETKHPNKPVEKFGPEASAYAEKVLLGKEIQVQEGIEERDRYGRLLAYIWVGDTTYQEMILAEGLAVTAYLYNDLTMLDEFHEAQDIARNQKIGVWSIPGYATVDQEDGFNTVQVEKPKPQPVAATPKTTATGTTNQTEFFQNCTELRVKYPKGVPAGHPAYQSKMDRDKDDYACE